MFALLLFLCYIPLGIIGALTGGFSRSPDGHGSIVFSILVLIFALAIFVPALAVQVRRFHDQDKSGWFVLLGLIPLVGGLITLVFMCLEGTRGSNKFGPDPKADPAGAFS